MVGICKLTHWEMYQLMRAIIMSIRMTKSKKVSSSIWGIKHKVLVSVKGTNHIAYFMFPVVLLDTFCKSLGTNGLMDLKIVSKVLFSTS